MPGPHDLRRPEGTPARPQRGGSLVPKASPYATSPDAFRRILAIEPIDVVFLLDVSGSMEGEPRREMVAGVRAAARALTGKGARITVIAFSDGAETILARSRSEEAIGEALDRLPHGGGTAMDRGFLEARGALSDSERAIVHLVTDGMPNDRAATLAQARLCHKAGIAVRCTGTTGADLEFLRSLAGGEGTRRAELVTTGGLRRAIESTAVAALPSPSRRPELP